MTSLTFKTDGNEWCDRLEYYRIKLCYISILKYYFSKHLIDIKYINYNISGKKSISVISITEPNLIEKFIHFFIKKTRWNSFYYYKKIKII